MSENLQRSVTLSRLFSWADARHYRPGHTGRDSNGQYEVCGNPICRLFWGLENLLWYGGEAGR